MSAIHLVPVVIVLEAPTRFEAAEAVQVMVNSLKEELPGLEMFLPNDGDQMWDGEEWHLEWQPGSPPEDLGDEMRVRWDPEKGLYSNGDVAHPPEE